MALPPLPAIGKIRIEIFEAGGGQPGAKVALWDEARWDVDTWPIFDWHNITPQSMVVKCTWGADDPEGVLTVPAAGSWTITTYDPDRLLDPSNGASQHVRALRPGKPIRLSYVDAAGIVKVVRQGLIDEVEYDLTERKGTLRGTDQVQLLVGAKLPENLTGAPTTLRAQAQWVIDRAHLTALIPVEPLPPDTMDPLVGPLDSREQSAWQHILTAAYDVLHAVWMDRSGVLRFRSFGAPLDRGFQAGGTDGIPISSMTTQGSLQGVFTHITTHDLDDAPDGNGNRPVITAFDATKASIYGDVLLHRDRAVKEAQTWVDSVLADRAGAALQYSPGTLYPQTEEALEGILDLGMVEIAHLVVESVQPTLDVAARVLGGTINADTSTGWTAQLLTYVPAKEWEDAEVPPIIIPPPGNTISGVVRTYACTKDSRLAHSSSLDAGNGLDVNLPIGWISPYRNRAVLAFAAIPFGGVVSVDKAELLVTIGANSCGAFGSDPKVNVSRLTGGFTEGDYNVACGFGTSNAVKYPGPKTTSSGAVTSTVPKSTGSAKAINITEIVRQWFAGQGQHGLMVKSAGEDSSKYTTAFYARHHGTVGNRPSLRLTLTIQA